MRTRCFSSSCMTVNDESGVFLLKVCELKGARRSFWGRHFQSKEKDLHTLIFLSLNKLKKQT